jgi:putative membrane protein
MMLAEWYLWIKAVHVMAVISWMAGLFYLPRLFVYHADAAEPALRETFRVMERRLYRAIMWPAMVVAWSAGLLLIAIIGFAGGWLHVKLLMVVLLTLFHFLLGWHVARFARDAERHSSRYFRIINEVPTVLMVVIVIMVIVKPF